MGRQKVWSIACKLGEVLRREIVRLAFLVTLLLIAVAAQWATSGVVTKSGTALILALMAISAFWNDARGGE